MDKNLELEGIARDLLRFIQQKRKDLGFAISDRINIKIYTNSRLIEESLALWLYYIKEQALAEDLILEAWQEEIFAELLPFEEEVKIVIERGKSKL